MRALPRERPSSLTAPHDGLTLDEVIGDLQSQWGVPQYPQEYRITIKVADEREPRPERPVEDQPDDRIQAPAIGGMPRREKAPAPPRVVATGDGRGEQPLRRRRRRRGRRGRGTQPS